MALSLKQPVRLAADAAAAIPKDLRQEIVRLKVCMCLFAFVCLFLCLLLLT
jgi:ATP-dependent RNA helicase DDX27